MLKPTLLVLCAAACLAGADPLTFRAQEIGTGLSVVYALTTADVNGDKKPDVVAITSTQLIWFENPSWTKHVVVEKVTQRRSASF